MLRSGKTHGRRVSLSTPSSAPTDGRSPPHELGRMRRRKLSQSMRSDPRGAKAQAQAGDSSQPAASSAGQAGAFPTAKSGATQASEGDMADLERSMAALKFVP